MMFINKWFDCETEIINIKYNIIKLSLIEVLPLLDIGNTDRLVLHLYWLQKCNGMILTHLSIGYLRKCIGERC